MRKFLYLSLGAAIALTIAFTVGCGKKAPEGPIEGLYADLNCSLAAEAKSNRIIGAYSAHAVRSGRVDVSVSRKPMTAWFNDQTKWTFTKEIPDLNTLRTKPGHCLAIDYKKDGDRFVATRIIVTENLKLDPKVLIEFDEFKSIMGEAKLFDCRPGFAVANGTIPGSAVMPPPVIADVEKFEKTLNADKNDLIIFFCGGFAWHFAPHAGQRAIDLGYKRVRVYHAGHPDWRSKGMASEMFPGGIKANIDNKNPMVLIDIRKNAAAEHIPGAFAVASANIDSIKGMLPQSPRDKNRAQIIVYGAKDQYKEALAAANTIASWGYRSAAVMRGGFDAYKGVEGAQIAKNQLVRRINYVAKRAPGEFHGPEFINLVKNGIPADAIVIDVREANEVSEFPGVTAFGAQHVPLANLSTAAKDFDKNKKIYVLCATGLRAKMGRDDLANMGFTAFYVDASLKSDGAGGIAFDQGVITAADIARIKK